jgi:riboflavin kinase/FMN adenylyltransferase
MKIIQGINKIRKFKNPVVALGVFDGVHRGHQRILKAAVEKARSIKGTSVVVTFWPDPHREESLYSLEHRLRLIAAIGVEACVVINFNKRFALILAEDFIKSILVDKLGAEYIFVGKNYRFGSKGKGDFRTLKEFSRIYNFKLRIFDIIKINHQPISSTYIRGLISRGDLAIAEKLLGRPVSLLGTVIKGISLATKLGFPTANIDPHHEVLPPSGIYAANVIFDDSKFGGACYIGTSPTLKSKKAEKHIEVHIFDFKKNIYGKYLEIQFIKKIREDKEFRSFDSLVGQVKKDIAFAKRLIN